MRENLVEILKTKPYAQEVLTTIKTKPYMSEIDLRDDSGQNWQNIQDVLMWLSENNFIAPCGSLYSKKFNKLFKYYTSAIEHASSLENTITNRLFEAQNKLLAKNIIEDLREHNSVDFIKVQYDFIKKNNSKKHLKYFLLEIAQIEEIYKYSIKHGAELLQDAKALVKMEITNNDSNWINNYCSSHIVSALKLELTQ